MVVYYLVTALHVLVCVLLILVVLLQSSKGADLAGAFGGATTQTAFGSRGPASFLSKLTTVSAVLFMGTCLALSLMNDKSESRSILDTAPGTPAPVSPPAAPAAPEQQPAAPTPDEIKRIQQEIEQRQKQEAAKGPAAVTGAAGSQTSPAPEKETKPPDSRKKP